jgi:hypothetical protein
MYHKKYHTHEEEEMRKAIFIENLHQIEEHNMKYHEGEVSNELGLNRFTDMVSLWYRIKLGIYLRKIENSWCVQFIYLFIFKYTSNTIFASSQSGSRGYCLHTGG